ncbi:ABC transporter ATP-binding protein [Algiphilus aromaticivorans]|jgi:oligopeptide/dipeptide ABC transporter ATP-binding protein|uniref:ABC transporter ATP-binding protein n=1 Tax=Algiphilus aromaticivorans TaxID=382454 RepID=UPI0018DD578C|nr:ABC transporter ATP-binding protein [Algiphilus aromaticivorans]
MADSAPLLAVRDLRVTLGSRAEPVYALDGVDLQLAAGDSLGIVGESGAGKSQLALALMGLSERHARVEGQIRVAGHDLLAMPVAQRRHLRGPVMAMIFQDPMRALNPYLRVGTQLTEAMAAHGIARGKAARAEALRLLERVRIPQAAERLRQYPHELSGGMRQRVMIAMALSCKPQLLIADEATTALDVTVQAGILALLEELRREDGLALLMISHDLGVIAQSCAHTLVLYAGRVAETGPTQALIAHPHHPYSDGLLRARPSLEARAEAALPAIPGVPPDPRQLTEGCAFAPRCPRADASCRRQPPLTAMGATAAACHHPL